MQFVRKTGHVGLDKRGLAIEFLLASSHPREPVSGSLGFRRLPARLVQPFHGLQDLGFQHVVGRLVGGDLLLEGLVFFVALSLLQLEFPLVHAAGAALQLHLLVVDRDPQRFDLALEFGQMGIQFRDIVRMRLGDAGTALLADRQVAELLMKMRLVCEGFRSLLCLAIP